MSDLQQLETMAEMVGFRYAGVHFDVDTKVITLQCEDREGSTLTVSGDSLDDVMTRMIAKLSLLAERADD